MTTFDEREKGFEVKYKHDQELRFKVTARRNKLLGLWAAGQMGLSGADAAAYATEVVKADFDAPGEEDVIAKVVKDLAAKGSAIGAEEVRKQMALLLERAKSEIAKGV